MHPRLLPRGPSVDEVQEEQEAAPEQLHEDAQDATGEGHEEARQQATWTSANRPGIRNRRLSIAVSSPVNHAEGQWGGSGTEDSASLCPVP